MRKQPAKSQDERSQKKQNSAQPTPYDIMRSQNCKAYQFRKDEMYPSIRPPIVPCYPQKSEDLLCQTMETYGCKCYPRLSTKSDQRTEAEVAENAKKKTNLGYPAKNMFVECKTSRHRQKRKFFSQEDLPQNNLDWNTLTPYDLMRMQNCKAFNFKKCESYPNIRPPISQCNTAQTAEWLIDAVDDAGCGRYFDMEQDDVIDVWKNSPNKQMLSYYGVTSGIPKPEAVLFNQMISKSLAKATDAQPTAAQPKSEQEPTVPHSTGLCSSFVLNRDLLHSKISNMPTVRRKIDALDALTQLHCPPPVENQYPFLAGQPKLQLASALDMERPARKPKHGRRPKYKYCQLQCYIRENKCTDYEWRKYKQDPKPYELAFKMEMAKMEQGDPEPRNYDELYSELVTCFEMYTKKDSLCKLYDKCCKRKRKLGDSGGPGGEQPQLPESPRKPSVQRPSKVKPPHGADGDEKQPGTEKPDKTKHKPKKEKPDKAQTDKDKSDKDKSDKEKSDKEKSDKEKADKEKADKEKADKEKADKEKAEKEKADKEKADKEKADKEKADKEKEDKDQQKNQEESPNKPIDTFTGEYTDKDRPSKPLTQDKHSDKEVHIEVPKKPKPHKPHKHPKLPPTSNEPIKDCPCEICDFMKRRKTEVDTPLISKLKREEKQQQLRDYYKRMCHREYMKCRKPEYCAPQRKCDPIKCDNIFCCNPKLGEYCDCLDAMQQLQKLLGPKHRIVENELIFNVEDLKRRICRRFCDCL